MIITKTIIGFVAQRYDTDTGKFLSQEFVGSDERGWENSAGDTADVPNLNGVEPYLNMEMVQPNYDVQLPATSDLPQVIPFNIGDEVLVTPLEDGSEPTEEFQGVVIATKDSRYVQVRDQDNNVFDCEPNQVQSVK